MSSLKSFAGSSTYRDMLNVYDHILDPNERRRLLLAEIDKSPFGWYHVRAVVVAGAGFFTDAYDVRSNRPAVAGASADRTHFKDLRYQPHHRNARPGVLAGLA
jgi:hypothetical protein